VNGFTLDPTSGEFVLTHPNIRCPNKAKIYSINEGYSKFWFPPVKNYINKLKDPQDSKSVYSQRYVGRYFFLYFFLILSSMVADVHRTLLYGGIFLYPGKKIFFVIFFIGKTRLESGAQDERFVQFMIARLVSSSQSNSTKDSALLGYNEACAHYRWHICSKSHLLLFSFKKWNSHINVLNR
jgi:hypothetical protein